MKLTKEHFSKAAAIITIVVSLLALVGWVFNIPVLKSILPQWPAIKFNATIGLLLSGITLYLLNKPSVSPTEKKLAQLFASFILILGLLTLSQYLFGYNAGIDELFWKDDSVAATYPGRLSLLATINFMGLGIVFLLLPNRKFHLIVKITILLMIPGLTQIFLNYSFGTSLLQFIPQSTYAAFHGVILFPLLVIGIILSTPLSYLTFSFQNKITGFFALVILMMLLIFSAIKENQQQIIDSSKLLDHTRAVIIKSEKLLADAIDLQLESRGFVITGDEKFLEHYTTAIKSIDTQLEDLRVLTIDNPGHQLKIDSLEMGRKEHMNFAALLIEVRKTGGLDEAITLIQTGQGKFYNDRVRRIINDLQQDETNLSEKYKAVNQQNIENSKRAVIVFQIIIGIVLLIIILIIRKNILARNKAEEKLFSLTERLQIATVATNIGIWDWDVVKNVLIWDETMYKIFGIKKEDFGGAYEAWAATVHPDDFAKGNEEVQSALKGDSNFHTEFRIVWPDKSIHYITGDASVERNADGVATRMVGTNLDITERKKVEKKLLDAELQYRTLFEQSPDGISVIDTETLLPIEFNEKIHTQLGYSREEFSQLKISDYEMIYTPEVIKTRAEKIMREGQNSFETRHKTKNGDIRDVQVTILKITFHDKPVLYTIFRDITEKRKIEEELKQQGITSQRQITEATIQAQEKERFELGKELHDNINQILATIKIYLGMAKAKENIPRNLVEQSYEYVSQAIAEIRKLAHTLHKSTLGDTSLKEALQHMVKDINLLDNLQLRLIIDDAFEKKDIDQHKELMLYRIVQEQLSNIIKHAKAQEVVINIKIDETSLFLSVTDNGVGFDTSQKVNGIGLKNIRSRVEFYSGSLNIISAPGQGCTMEIMIPV